MINITEEPNLQAIPYKHIFSEYAVNEDLHNKIIDWLEVDAAWNLVEADFYTQYEMDLYKADLPPFLDFITSTAYLNYLKSYVEKIYNVSLLEKFDVVAHKLVKDHIIKIHNDYLDDQRPRESHRLLLHLNRNWHIDNGGLCMVFSDNNSESVTSIVSPEGKVMQSFEISKNSYHAVSKIYKGNRLTIIFTFYMDED